MVEVWVGFRFWFGLLCWARGLVQRFARGAGEAKRRYDSPVEGSSGFICCIISASKLRRGMADWGLSEGMIEV